MIKKVLIIAITSLLIVASVIMYFIFAGKTYSVTFISNNGTVNNVVKVAKGKTVTPINEPVKEGYAFDGWFLADEKFDFTTKIVNDIILNARWSDNSNQVIVTFDTLGGSNIQNQVLTKGEKVIKPEDPTKEGYKFIQWQAEGIKFDFDTELSSSITLVALWEEDTSIKKYTVTFNSDGGSSVQSIKVAENSTLTKPSNPTKSGYTFVRWELNGSEYNFSSKVTKDITLKAKWAEESNVKKYTVTFNSDGGSSVNNQSIVENTSVSKPSNPTKTNYTFVRWDLSGSEYNFTSKVTKDITLKAIWKENDKVTVTFNSDGGSSVSPRQVYKGSNLGSLPSNPTKNGYTFDGWYDGQTKYTDTSKVNSNITLKAKWIDSNEVAVNNAKNAINSSYNIVSGGQSIEAEYTGCTIALSNPNVISKITRGLTDTNVTLEFNITCGSKTGTKSATGVIKASPYTYAAVPNANMQNYDLTIKQGANAISQSGTLYSMAGEYLSDVSSGRAIINNDDISSYPNYKVVLGNSNTIYVVKKQ